GAVRGPGSRAYLAVRGGLDVPAYLGSRATFTLGRFGGHAGRALRAGDVLHLDVAAASAAAAPEAPLDAALVPPLASEGEIPARPGPHSAPAFFTAEDIDAFFAATWKIHYNSSRTGVRLIGPKPEWARADGGEAGLHPSNLHDNAYAIGTVNFTGDMPVILGPDGPSLGGFVCPATIVQAELWKMGQLKPGDIVRFHAISSVQAAQMEEELEARIKELCGNLPRLPDARTQEEPILRTQAVSRRTPAVVCRADGDRHLLVEYGPNLLDLDLRFRVHALEEQLR